MISLPTAAQRITCVFARRCAASVLAIILVAGSLFADAKITLPASVSGDVGDFITVSATSSGAIVRWYSLDGNLRLFPTQLLRDTKVAVVIARTAGSYRLIAWTADASGPSEAALCVVTAGTPPGPPPSPSPTPPSPPAPTGPLHITVIIDPATETPGQAALLASQTLRAGLKAQYHVFRIFDVNDPVLASTGHKALVDKSGGAPVVVIQTKDGKVVPDGKANKLPSDEQSLLALITQAGG